MLKNKSKFRCFLEFIVLVALVTFAEYLPSLLINKKLGFFCLDTNLNYPMKRVTFTNLDLYLIVFTVPAVAIFINEAVILKRRGRLTNGTDVKAFLIYIYNIFYIIIFVAFCSKISVDFIKATTGRHRPNFIAYCSPINRTTRISISKNCEEGSFIEDYICASDEEEAFLSFVSGHSAFVTVSFGITIVYIQYRVLWSSIGLFKNVLQVILIVYGSYISLTRVSDYYHFPTDVIGGFVIGLLFIYIACTIVKEILIEEMQHFAKLTSSDRPNYEQTYSSIQTVY